MSESIFDETVLSAYGVCNNCFRKTHDVEENWFPRHKVGTPSAEMFQNPRAFHLPTETEESYVKTSNSVSQKTFSCKCGSLDGKAFGDNESSKDKLVEDFAYRVERRLDELNVPYDDVILRETVEDLKTDQSGEHTTDQEILREAVKKATLVNLQEYKKTQVEQ